MDIMNGSSIDWQALSEYLESMGDLPSGAIGIGWFSPDIQERLDRSSNSCCSRSSAPEADSENTAKDSVPSVVR